MKTFVLLIASLTLFACPGRLSPGFNCNTEDCESCDVIAAKLSWDDSTKAFCAQCEHVDAGTSGCEGVPTLNGKHVIRGCNDDASCRADSLSNYCGRYASSPHYTCVTSDPI